MKKKKCKVEKIVYWLALIVFFLFIIAGIPIILKPCIKDASDYSSFITVFSSVIGGLLTLIGVIITIRDYRAKDKEDKFSDISFEYNVELNYFYKSDLMGLLNKEKFSCDFFVIGQDVGKEEDKNYYLRMDLFFTVDNCAINSLCIDKISFNKTGLDKWAVIDGLSILNKPSANLVQVPSNNGCPKYRLGLVFQGEGLKKNIIELIQKNCCILELQLDICSMVGTSIGIFYEINFKNPVKKIEEKKQILQIENICKKYL